MVDEKLVTIQEIAEYYQLNENEISNLFRLARLWDDNRQPTQSAIRGGYYLPDEDKWVCGRTIDRLRLYDRGVYWRYY